jgi:phosphoribosylamine--glycine ligase
MEKEKKNILIIGRGATEQALAKKLSQNPRVGVIFIASGSKIENSAYRSVDIREDDLTGLLKFALDYDVDLTIPISEKALNADVVSFFASNGQNVFGPSKEACNVILNKSAGKKFLYKIHAQTSKFGVFDRINQAQDYLRTTQYPIVIRSGDTGERLVSATTSLSEEILDELFTRKGETNVLIEEYTYGHNFTIYYITDGYSALPLSVVANYKFAQEGDGGLLTNGVGCFVPDYKVSALVMSRVDNIVRNTLVALEKKGEPYLGIIGVDCTLTGEDKFFVNEFKPFLQDCDAEAILNIVEDDLFEIFTACIEGLFSDEYEQIKTSESASVATVVSSRKANSIISGLEDFENFNDINFLNVSQSESGQYVAGIGETLVITKTSSTLNRAKKLLDEDLSQIHFDGMKYRKDIATAHEFDF